MQIIERRLAFEADPAGFTSQWRRQSDELAQQIASAIDLLPQVDASHGVLRQVAQTCMEAGVDGHRADITMVRAARALAAWNARTEIVPDDLSQAAHLVLPHRMRRHPLETIGRVQSR